MLVGRPAHLPCSRAATARIRDVMTVSVTANPSASSMRQRAISDPTRFALRSWLRAAAASLGRNANPGRALLCCWTLVVGVCSTAPAHAACPPQSVPAATLSAAQPPVDPQLRNRTTEALIACLASPDPALRDTLGYETLQRWLRSGAFSPSELGILRAQLYAMLDAPDPDGVARPFAALVLSELARTDRVAPWMSAEARAEMVERAASQLEQVQDYRGYRSDVGWRHGVAHGADWAMQLALNPALDRAQMDRLLSAIARQAVPASGHAYVFGEPARLARPVLFIAKRAVHDEAQWSAWLSALLVRLGDPALAWKDEAWLGRRHDLATFLQALYIDVDLSEDPGIARLRPGVLQALKSLP